MKLSNRVNEKTFDIKNALPGILYILLVFFSFAFFAWLAENIPYTQDDWPWGIEKGWNDFLAAEINSRYTGNFLVIVLTRIELFKIGFMAFVFTLIPVLCTEMALLGVNFDDAKRKNTARIIIFMLCNVLIFVMPRVIWRQSYGWVSGFANFVASMPALLGYILILVKLPECGKISKTKTALLAVLLFVYGVVVQMFIENITLYLVFISLLYIFVLWIRKRKANPLFWFLLLGCLVGCLIMFSSSLYDGMLQDGGASGGIRHVTFNAEKSFFTVITETAGNFCKEFFPRFSADNSIICCVISFLMLLKFQTSKEEISAAGYRKAVPVVNLAFIAFYIYCSCCSAAGSSPLPALPLGLLNAAFMLLIALELLPLYKRDVDRLIWMMFIWLSPILVMAPLAAVIYWGDRQFITGRFFYIIFCGALLAELWSTAPADKRVLRAAAMCICACAFVFQLGKYFVAYREIGTVNWEREVLFEGAINGEYDRILMPTYVHWRYLWGQDPRNLDDKPRIEWFREFYSIPDDVELWFETWGDPPEVWHLPE